MTEKITPILEKIREERIIHNVKQKEIAAILDVDIRTYNNIENGKSNLTLPQLFTIAEYFKKDVSHFINSSKTNHIENSNNSGVFYDSSAQHNHSNEAIKAYKLLTERLLTENKELKEKLK